MVNGRSPRGMYPPLPIHVSSTDTYNYPQRQLASLSAKVQAYEDVIRKLSSRFGVSDEQLMGIALNVVWAEHLPHIKSFPK